MRICTPSAVVTYTPDGCVSTYPDGASYGAQPHDTHHYHVIAHRCGYGDEILAYCREHEVVHHFLGTYFHWREGGVSPVIWKLAHGEEIYPSDAAMEEAMVMTFQRWLRANERPIIGGVNWDELKRQALALLNA